MANKSKKELPVVFIVACAALDFLLVHCFLQGCNESGLCRVQVKSESGAPGLESSPSPGPLDSSPSPSPGP